MQLKVNSTRVVSRGFRVCYCDALAHVSRALRQLHVSAWSFDWFTGLSLSLVIGLSDSVVVLQHIIQNRFKILLHIT